MKAYSYIDNNYSSSEGAIHQHLAESAFEIAVTHVQNEIQPHMKTDCSIYYAPISLNDLQANIITVLRVLRWCAPRGQLGTNTWVNITGGTNVINSSLLIAAQLMGTVGRLYYTYVSSEYNKYLRPAREDKEWEDSFWCEIPPLRIDQNEGVLLLLAELRKHKDRIDDEQLLQTLATRESGRGLFRYSNDPAKRAADLYYFRTYYLNKLGTYIKRIGEHSNLITPKGLRLYEFLKTPEIRSLLLSRTDNEQITPEKAGLTRVWPITTLSNARNDP